MLDNFFSLNGSITEILDQTEFERLLDMSSSFKNALYKSNELKESTGHRDLRIKDCSFSNFSFSKTKIKNTIFINCQFTDCLFIGVKIKDCEFINCHFSNVNTYKITIENTYINPDSFVGSIKGIDKSNIAIHLFQQLLQNSRQQSQPKFSRIAEYNFNKWRDNLTLNKFWKGKPYKISFWQFLKEYPLNILFMLTFGYGLRFRNFIVTFLICFISFFFVNMYNWTNYSLKEKDICIDAFNPDSTGIVSNLLYTMDVTTKLIDSQFQPTSDTGMFWLSFQSVVAFILLSALITILINRFVK